MDQSRCIWEHHIKIGMSMWTGSTGSGKDPVKGSCEHENDPLGSAVTMIQMKVFIHKVTWLSVPRSQKLFLVISSCGFIYESNSASIKSEYLYLQYHWFPIKRQKISWPDKKRILLHQFSTLSPGGKCV